MRRILSEPLLHFLLLGMALFLLYREVSPNADGDRRIVVTDATINMLSQRYASVWMRPPTPAELQTLVDTFIRDEILYREGVAMGLDRNDPVIQRRVLQKLDVLSEEGSLQNPPTDAELNAYLLAHAQSYAVPPIISFEQVMLDPVRHGAALEADFNAALAKLNAGAGLSAMGDSSLLPAQVGDMPLDRVARDYGDDFANELQALPVGSWQGPVRSGFGIHAVRVTGKVEGRVANLNDVRAAVERDWENERRIKARDTYYQNLRKGYDVQMDADLSALSAMALQEDGAPVAAADQPAQ